MQRTIEIDSADPAPIWRQIEERVRRLVASGLLAPSSAVPSVRELSRTLRINPATVAKAYQRLVDTGVLQVRRGEGTYVADQPPALALGERHDTLREGATRYASLAMSVGAGRDEATHALTVAWAELVGQQEGNTP
jgi:GntR family transcriptional regulator